MILFSIVLSTIFCQIISVSTIVITDQDPTNQITKNILFKYITTEVGTHKIHNSRASWNDARNICLDENAQLAVIDTAAEEAMIMKHMKANGMDAAWLGVHDLFGKKQWTTIMGERLFTSQRYVHWRNGEPNNTGDGEHCAVLYDNGMNDVSCDWEVNGFVCEKISNNSQELIVS